MQMVRACVCVCVCEYPTIESLQTKKKDKICMKRQDEIARALGNKVERSIYVFSSPFSFLFINKPV